MEVIESQQDQEEQIEPIMILDPDQEELGKFFLNNLQNNNFFQYNEL